MSHDRSHRNRRWLWVLAAALFVLHHDFWFWNDRTLVLGFLPIGLAYHMLYSVAAAGLWLAMLKFAWPEHIEEYANGVAADAGGKEEAGR